jgi:hypothetical protein
VDVSEVQFVRLAFSSDEADKFAVSNDTMLGAKRSLAT